ncbi:MAG: threonine/serine dehydratase [Candidatus Puniceispirillaceae bacterium]|jgi:threonine dehydratase
MAWQAEITAADHRIGSHIRRTPVMQVDNLVPEIPVALKLEHLQHTGSFKARGAFNSLLAADVPKAGIVAASGGNHGAAVAYAAKSLGHECRIFIPETASPAKIEMIRRSGVEPVIIDGVYADALNAAAAFEADHGAISIHAYDDVATVCGQGTVLREWEAQGLEADTILVAVGGGGLIAGALAWLDGRRKVVAVEPETACALHAALAAGSQVDVAVSGVAASALGAGRVGDICFGLAREQQIESILVSDTAIIDAQRALWQNLRLAVEPGGAATIAALMTGAYSPQPGERVAALICGANVDIDF